MSVGHVRRRSRSSFEIKFDLDSDGARRTVYRSYRGSKRAAQAELHRLLTQVADGSHTDPSKITISEWLRDRLTHWRATGVISPKTAERYGDLVTGQVEPFLGTKLLQRLNTRDIEAWHRTLQTEGRKDRSGGISARTTGHAHRIVAKALRDAVRHELVRRNVATEQRPPRVVAEEMQILTADQVAGLAARLDGHPLAAPALTALFTGMRRGELLALDWGHTDVDRKVINVVASLEATRAGIRRKGPKTKAGVREITLPSVVVDVLRAQRQTLLERRLLLGLGKLKDTDLVFPAWDGSAWDPNALSAAWSKAAEELGLAVSFHQLRHTHASQLIDAGVDIVTIAKRLGHSSPSVTLQVYAHLFRKDDSKAAAAIDAALGR
jgi:integrase